MIVWRCVSISVSASVVRAEMSVVRDAVFRHQTVVSFQKELCSHDIKMAQGGEGEVAGSLPYVAYTGAHRWTGYGFWPLYTEQGM